MIHFKIKTNLLLLSRMKGLILVSLVCATSAVPAALRAEPMPVVREDVQKYLHSLRNYSFRVMSKGGGVSPVPQ